MQRNFTLEYWKDGLWYVGKLKEVPGVFSQGKTIQALERNIREVYKMMQDENEVPDAQATIKTKQLRIAV